MDNSLAASDISIKDLRQCPQWLDLLAQWHYGHWPQKGSLDNRRASLRAHLKSDALPTTLVLITGDTPIGSITLSVYRRREKPDAPSYWVANAFVEPQWRGHGCGRLLLRAVETLARRLDVRNLLLNTTDQVGFYQHHGWRLKQKKVIEGEVVSVMQRHLDAPCGS